MADLISVSEDDYLLNVTKKNILHKCVFGIKEKLLNPEVGKTRS